MSAGRLTGAPVPQTSCILVQTCDSYRMVNIIPLLLGGADGPAALLYRQRGYVPPTGPF